MAFELARLLAAMLAAELELMTTDMGIFLDVKRGVRAAVVSGRFGSGSRRPRVELAACPVSARR
jgi:hypothetical protein